MPVRRRATAATVADCGQAAALIDGLAADYSLADQRYDTNQVSGGAGWRYDAGDTAPTQP